MGSTLFSLEIGGFQYQECFILDSECSQNLMYSEVGLLESDYIVEVQ